ncbi:MAG: SIMPL domain-containing protein [Pseudomonadales bacterium]
MQPSNRSSSLILGLCLLTGLAILGFLLGKAALDYKQLDRSVTVKGLAERELNADIVIWPIQFTLANNDLQQLYESIERDSAKIRTFLAANGVSPEEISQAAPAITDKSANMYGGDSGAQFRYTAQQIVTVYSENISAVRKTMSLMPELGKQGIVLTGGYESQPEYLFTRLNEIKPEMIEEATRKAREVAAKFAADSASTLGKIRQARQGQFSISPRDQNNPHIKKVRVVSTVEYYLSD